MKKKQIKPGPHLGLLTLGQSPRRDVIPSFEGILGKRLTLIEAGALDGLGNEQINALLPGPLETGIQTRLAGGSEIFLSKERLLPYLIEKAVFLGNRCRYVVLLCSGDFPALRSACSGLLEPVIILRGIIKTLAGQKTLGVIGPASDLKSAPEQWQPYAGKVVCAAASPYAPVEQAAIASKSAVNQGAQVLLLDDMGFNQEHRAQARKAVDVPVICATTVTARVLTELI
ncbi:AroM family protein [Desulfospira joergensenii]|uniref:AroM family protein n=1 Tax=Desulfospira joergensenii TaxID=53329 RepID=UPI0003B54ADE|nr:AroM family protein [Desulfospira joergensenii]